MDIMEQAVYSLVHDFGSGKNKGAPALSIHLNLHYGYKIKPGTLMNKANPEQEHQLTVKEAVLIQKASQRFDLLYAESHVLNHSVIPLGDFSTTSDVEFLATYTKMHAALGDMAQMINGAFKDNRISRNEVKGVRTTAMAVIRSILEMEKRLSALCDEPTEYEAFL